MKNQLVSIIIPSYNSEKFIENTLKSVLKQTYSNFEVIVIDDGSKDKSAEIIKQMSSFDDRIRYIYQSNSGVSIARNNGIINSSGNYIAVLDSDDIWLPENLEKKIKLLNENSDIDRVFCDIDLIDISGKILETLKGSDLQILNKLLVGDKNIVPGICSNVIFRKKCINGDIVKFDPNLSTSADRDFAIQLASRYDGRRLDEVLVQCLKYGGNMSENIKLFEKDMIYLLKKIDSQNLFPSNLIKSYSMSNFYQSMVLSYRKIDLKISLHYFLKMIRARPSSFLKLLSLIFFKLNKNIVKKILFQN